MRTRTVDDMVQLIRAHLRDYPELNRLITGEESGNGMIKLAMGLAIDEWNTTPPPLTTVDVATFPSESLLILGTVVWLYDQLSALSIRNYSQISDAGGVASVDGGNVGLLQNRHARLQQLWQRRLREHKKMLNINAAFGGSGVRIGYDSY